jgi:hypothetical protein
MPNMVFGIRRRINARRATSCAIYPTKLNVGSGNEDTIKGFGGNRPVTGASIFM